LTYNEGETFDPEGLALLLRYDDQSERLMEYEGNESLFSFTPSINTPLKTSDDSVTIGFGGMNVNQEITVNGAPAPAFDWIPILLGALVIIAFLLVVLLLLKKRWNAEGARS
jgi:hypothetical protein